jgi:uncharacterized membrane protein YbhN (UPF0104 family)
MKKALVTILQYVLFLGLGIWIVYHMLHELTPQQETELVAAIKSIDAWYLIPICIAGFFSHFFRALRWRYLLDTVDAKPTVLNTTFSVMIGYITNLAVPRAGEVAKCTVLAKYEKTPAHKMIGTIVAERAFDILCLIIIAVTAFLLQFNVINDYIGGRMHRMGEKIHSHEDVVIGVLAALVLFIVASIIIYRRSRETKFGRFMKEMNHGILSILHMKKRRQFIVYTVLIWLMYVLQIYIGLKSLPATHNLSILAALVVLVYGSVGMIVTPGGIGLYPFLVAQILGVYLISDVPAQAFGWIAWAVQTGLIIILGVLSLLFIHPYNKKRDAQAGLDTAPNI